MSTLRGDGEALLRGPQWVCSEGLCNSRRNNAAMCYKKQISAAALFFFFLFPVVLET